MPNWFTIAENLGIWAILVAALTWLTKHLIAHFLSKDLDKHKFEIKAASDRKIEQFKTELQIIAHERKETFSRLHEQRALIIAELYAKVSDFLGAGQLLGGRLIFGTVRKAEDIAKDTIAQAKDLSAYFSRHKIYFSPALTEAMNELIFMVYDLSVQVKEAIDIPESRRDFEKWFSDNLDQMMNTFSNCQKIIETEFRQILGVDINTK